jgi:hypothetical protein
MTHARRLLAIAAEEEARGVAAGAGRVVVDVLGAQPGALEQRARGDADRVRLARPATTRPGTSSKRR